jgi:hypothetical protein
LDCGFWILDWEGALGAVDQAITQSKIQNLKSKIVSLC